MSTPQNVSWLFLDDDEGGVSRYPLSLERLHIGRDPSNEIVIDHLGCAAHAVVLYERDGAWNVKVYDGARVGLNGSHVSGMHRLYSGDKIRIADRTFIYGRDDSPPEACLAVTVFRDGEAERCWIMRQTLVKLGRHVGDISVGDLSVVDDQLTIEFYAPDAVFLMPNRTLTSTRLNGQPVRRRVRLQDQQLLQAGTLTFRVAVVDPGAHGLMAPVERADVVLNRRYQVGSGDVEPEQTEPPELIEPEVQWSPPALDDEVPETVIGSVPELLSTSEGSPPATEPLPPVAQGGGHRGRRAQERVASVRLSAELQREAMKSARPGDMPPKQQRAFSMHDLETQTLFVGSRYGSLTEVQGTALRVDPTNEYVPPREDQPIYRPSREGRDASLPELQPSRWDDGRGEQPHRGRWERDQRSAEETFRRQMDWQDEAEPSYRPSSGRGGRRMSSQQPQLTGTLDVRPDRPRLDRSVHQPDPDAMAQSERRERPMEPVVLGYSHHNPDRQRAGQSEAKSHGPVDNSPRRSRRRPVDDSPRYYDDEDR